MVTFFEKLKRGLGILKLTNFRYFRAAQIKEQTVTFKINNKLVPIEGHSVLSMLFEIVLSDSYHLKEQKHPKTIFDVGANVGVFSIYAATLFPECDIYAFEPSGENFALLQKNTKRFSNIHCINMAVSNQNGMAYLSGHSDPTAFKIANRPSPDVLQQCPTITLQTFITEHAIEHIDILKLDCEGAEYDIIDEGITNVSQVVGEYHRLENRSTTDIRDALLKQSFIIKQWTNTPADNAGIFWAVRQN